MPRHSQKCGPKSAGLRLGVAVHEPVTLFQIGYSLIGSLINRVDLDCTLPHAFSRDWLRGRFFLVSAWEAVFYVLITLTTGVLGFVVYNENPALAKLLFVISALSLLLMIFDIVESVDTIS